MSPPPPPPPPGEVAFGVQFNPGVSLFPHQRRVLQWLAERDRAPLFPHLGSLLVAEMGLGKTIMGETWALSEVLRRAAAGAPQVPALAIVPVSLLYVWEQEWYDFFQAQQGGPGGLRVLVLHKDNPELDIDALTLEELLSYHLVITNYETVMYAARSLPEDYVSPPLYEDAEEVDGWLRPLLELPYELRPFGTQLLFATQWAAVLLDESHRISNPLTSTFLAVMLLRSRRKLCLSGTPIKNVAEDMFSQMRFLNFEEVTDRKEWSEAVYFDLQLQKHVLAMNYKEAGITLPRMHTEVLEVKLSPEEWDVFAFFMQRARGGNAAQRLAMITRARQACNSPGLLLTTAAEQGQGQAKRRRAGRAAPQGPLTTHLEPFAEEDPDALRLHEWILGNANTFSKARLNSSKLECLREHLRRHVLPAGEKFLVFSAFSETLRLIQEMLIVTGVCQETDLIIFDGSLSPSQRRAAQDLFRSTEPLAPRGLLLQNGAGAVGLTLTAANWVYMFDHWFSPAVGRQAVARIARIGQTRETHVVYLVASDTYDEYIINMQGEKQILSNQMIHGEEEQESKEQLAAFEKIMAKVGGGSGGGGKRKAAPVEKKKDRSGAGGGGGGGGGRRGGGGTSSSKARGG